LLLTSARPPWNIRLEYLSKNICTVARSYFPAQK